MSGSARTLRAVLGLIAGVGAIAALTAITGSRDRSASDELARALPAIEVRCEAKELHALEHAHACEQGAALAIERYPFRPRDGLRALRRLAEAAECYALAQRLPERGALLAWKARFRARLERDYRDHVLRYKLALAAQRPALALASLDYLLELLESERGPLFAALQRARSAIGDSSELEVAR
jgi:hypothetical protein